MQRYISSIRKMIVFVTVIIFILVGAQIVYGVVIEPGSQQDPIITQSYLEQVIQQRNEYIDKNISDLSERLNELEQNATPGQGAEQFIAIEVIAGQKLIGGAGTELILRTKGATIISSDNGGVADTTIGKDLITGEEMPPEHLLIIPRDDGRGFVASNNVWVLVKGSYVIE